MTRKFTYSFLVEEKARQSVEIFLEFFSLLQPPLHQRRREVKHCGVFGDRRVQSSEHTLQILWFPEASIVKCSTDADHEFAHELGEEAVGLWEAHKFFKPRKTRDTSKTEEHRA